MVAVVCKIAVRVMSVLVALVCARDASALSLTLAWDIPNDSTIVGYVVSYGTTSGYYTNAVNAGNSDRVYVTNLLDQTPYYFAVQSYDAKFNLSAYSAEIAFQPLSLICHNTNAVSPDGAPVAVTLIPPDVFGGLGTKTTICTPHSGSFFPVGNTPLTCSTTDVTGTATCQSQVTVTTVASGSRAVSDFDGDGLSDPGIFRPTSDPALWYSTLSGGGAFQIYFGSSDDIPVVGDYDGDGKADAVTWQPSTGLWYGPRTGAGTIVIQLALGQYGDIPVPCDYNGDGAIDPAIYRPSTGLWFGTTADSQTVVLNTNLGVQPGDIPVPADYDGDGKCDPAIMRPGAGPDGTNLWYAVLSGGGTFQIYFGAPGDIPIPADYDGDGLADAVIFRPSIGLWYGPRTGAGGIVTQMYLGYDGVIPIPADYDGDGATDPAIYDPNTGMFYGVNAAGNAVVLYNYLGAGGDFPTAYRPKYPH
jgi:hypothetical protein